MSFLDELKSGWAIGPEEEQKRKDAWNKIVQDNPELNDPAIQAQFLKSGLIPSAPVSTGNELRVTSGDKTEAPLDSGRGSLVQFPTTEVSPEHKPVVFGNPSDYARWDPTTQSLVKVSAPDTGGRPLQVVSGVDKEERLSGDQIKALQSGDVSQIATAFPTGVPAKTMEQFLRLKELGANKSDASETKAENEQNKLEQEFRQGIISVRGDASLHRVEDQRDAAITGYRTITNAEKKGRSLNPIEYVDTLGQIYKARTGAAPGEQVLQDMRQQTAKGNLGKVYTFFTGEQAPSTTEDIMKSLKDLVIDMGTQADQQHEAYMRPHMLPPKNLKQEYADRIVKEGRGLTFQDATGYRPEDNAPKTINSQEEYDALPRGSEYIDSHGRRARKK